MSRHGVIAYARSRPALHPLRQLVMLGCGIGWGRGTASLERVKRCTRRGCQRRLRLRRSCRRSGNVLSGSRRMPGGGLRNGLGRLAGLLLGRLRHCRNGSSAIGCRASNGLANLLYSGWGC